MADFENHPQNDAARLKVWMLRVLAERKKVLKTLSPDAIHNLRRAIARCQAMADGLYYLFPYPILKKVKEMTQPCFKPIGSLRDIHIMRCWAMKLSPRRNETDRAIADTFRLPERLNRKVISVLKKFDAEKWQLLICALYREVLNQDYEEPDLERSASRLCKKAYRKYKIALRSKKDAALHRLRRQTKKFRYFVENFLPKFHASFGKDLKYIHDLLGKYHDLEVFSDALVRQRQKIPKKYLKPLLRRIKKERALALKKYIQITAGKATLWPERRAALKENQTLP